MKKALLLPVLCLLFVAPMAMGAGFGSVHSWGCNWNGVCWERTDCAPEVKTGNIAATDRVLKELGASELKNAAKFNAIVKKAQALGEEKRLKAYLDLVGVETDAELAAFVGARQIDPKYVSTLSKNADLSQSEATFVIEKISAALLGQAH